MSSPQKSPYNWSEQLYERHGNTIVNYLTSTVTATSPPPPPMLLWSRRCMIHGRRKGSARLRWHPRVRDRPLADISCGMHALLCLGPGLSSQVLPSLRDRHDEFLLRELIRRWENHRIMNKWMQKFFMYLDRYYVKHHSLPTLEEAGRLPSPLHSPHALQSVVSPAVSATASFLVPRPPISLSPCRPAPS